MCKHFPYSTGIGTQGVSQQGCYMANTYTSCTPAHIEGVTS